MDPVDDTVVDESTTDALVGLAAFVAVAQARSFSGAARQLRQDKSLLSRRVRALEDRLAVLLLQRTTRTVRLTEAGQRLYEQAGPAFAAIRQAIGALNAAAEVKGVVRIASFVALSERVWPPVIARLLAEHPRLRVELQSTHRRVDLVAEGFDLALRGGHLPDSSLVGVKVAQWRYVLVASPDWVATQPPLDLERVAAHWLLFGDVERADHWRFERGEERRELRVTARLTTDDGALLVNAALAGLGVFAAAPFMVEHHLDAGRLVRVLPEWRVDHVLPLFVLYPHRAYLPAAVRAVVDAVKTELTEQSARWRGWTE